MTVMRYWDGSAWVILDANNANTVGGASLSEIQNFNNLTNLPTTISGYGITDAYTKTEVDNKLTSVYIYQGNVATYADLPSTGQVVGDVYNVSDTGENYAWDGTSWDDIGGTVPLATSSNSGLLSASDFSKLQNIDLSEYLARAGGTMLGNIDLNNNALNGVGNILFNDVSDSASEGIAFPLTAGGNSAIWIDGAGQLWQDSNKIALQSDINDLLETIQGNFSDTTLTTGLLTISHSQGDVISNYTIVDNNGKVIIPDEITFSNNSIEVDLSSYGTLTGTWSYIFGPGFQTR